MKKKDKENPDKDVFVTKGHEDGPYKSVSSGFFFFLGIGPLQIVKESLREFKGSRNPGL